MAYDGLEELFLGLLGRAEGCEELMEGRERDEIRRLKAKQEAYRHSAELLRTEIDFLNACDSSMKASLEKEIARAKRRRDSATTEVAVTGWAHVLSVLERIKKAY